VPLISFHFGLPRPATLDLIRGAGLLTVACATTVKEARAAEAAGVDFVVVQGAEAGGHRGTFYGGGWPHAPKPSLPTPNIAFFGLVLDSCAVTCAWCSSQASICTCYW
jgi:NAD(P)H-dependent flavin oxidoreductase YrpB (nitropropane dioxygenase family)